jgi:hypothetical protein
MKPSSLLNPNPVISTDSLKSPLIITATHTPVSETMKHALKSIGNQYFNNSKESNYILRISSDNHDTIYLWIHEIFLSRISRLFKEAFEEIQTIMNSLNDENTKIITLKDNLEFIYRPKGFSIPIQDISNDDNSQDIHSVNRIISLHTNYDPKEISFMIEWIYDFNYKKLQTRLSSSKIDQIKTLLQIINK